MSLYVIGIIMFYHNLSRKVGFMSSTISSYFSQVPRHRLSIIKRYADLSDVGDVWQHCLVPGCSLYTVRSRGHLHLLVFLTESCSPGVCYSRVESGFRPGGLWHLIPETWQRASWGGSLRIENILEPEQTLLCLRFGQCSIQALYTSSF